MLMDAWRSNGCRRCCHSAAAIDSRKLNCSAVQCNALHKVFVVVVAVCVHVVVGTASAGFMRNIDVDVALHCVALRCVSTCNQTSTQITCATQTPVHICWPRKLDHEFPNNDNIIIIIVAAMSITERVVVVDNSIENGNCCRLRITQPMPAFVPLALPMLLQREFTLISIANERASLSRCVLLESANAFAYKGQQ